MPRRRLKIRWGRLFSYNNQVEFSFRVNCWKMRAYGIRHVYVTFKRIKIICFNLLSFVLKYLKRRSALVRPCTV